MVYEQVSKHAQSTNQVMQVNEDLSPFVKPYHAAEMVDARLPQLVARKWTTVISDDELLRQLLNAFFLHCHPWIAAFHKDYFLDDMTTGRSRFCSPLLVNAVLAVACYASHDIRNSNEFWIPKSLGYQFAAEARRLREVEIAVGKNRLMTVQAGYLLTVVNNANGMDRIGLLYLIKALAMARELQIFKAPPSTMDERMQNARAFTAWGLFCWQA